MTSVGVAFAVTLGSLIGAAIILPNEEQGSAAIFATMNFVFTWVASIIVSAAFRFCRDTYARWW